MRIAAAAGATALALGALALSGCNIVAGAGYLAFGTDKAPALYEPDPNRPTSIIIDDRQSVIPQRSVRAIIGATADAMLLENKVFEDQVLIGSAGAAGVMARESYDQPMGVVQIGREVGAEVVIYARVRSFTLSQDQASYSPLAVLEVMVIDVTAESADSRLLYPTDGREFHTLAVSPKTRPGYLPQTRAEVNQATRELAAEAGRSLARMFYKHDPNPNNASTTD